VAYILVLLAEVVWLRIGGDPGLGLLSPQSPCNSIVEPAVDDHGRKRGNVFIENDVNDLDCPPRAVAKPPQKAMADEEFQSQQE
jgi:hypothetical protein